MYFATLQYKRAPFPKFALGPDELMAGPASEKQFREKLSGCEFVKFTVPQKFFCHFYTSAVVWTTFLLAAAWFYAYKMAPLVSEPLQYSSSESSNTERHGMAVCVSAFVDGSSSIELRCTFLATFLAYCHAYAAFQGRYFTDIWHLSELSFYSFYTAALLPLCCTFALETFVFASNRVVEFIVEGKNQIPAKEFDWWGFASPLMILRWYSWIGMAIFLWGWIHQHRCHAILGSLRKKPEQANEYVIPHGDWFDYVSSPHYLAGLVICAGLMVASGGADLTVWLIFGFVSANLVLAGAETHKWYLHKFDNYPRSRFAIVPFVFSDFSTEIGYTTG
ncbi:polyprenol reductase 2-like [Camellia sinensis]|uniref:polyprenol reductase 2-like n=1 Tax=Camellia sinensis TaxID=4442 RepID=UPI001035D01D|nr:polyprenol reductase 2-like [Camellia sinensis]